MNASESGGEKVKEKENEFERNKRIWIENLKKEVARAMLQPENEEWCLKIAVNMASRSNTERGARTWQAGNPNITTLFGKAK